MKTMHSVLQIPVNTYFISVRLITTGNTFSESRLIHFQNTDNSYITALQEAMPLVPSSPYMAAHTLS